MSLLPGITNGADAAVKTFTISPNTTKGPTGKKIKHKNLNKHTKQYFLIRTYLEYFEKQGGGKLVLKRGTYKIPNTLYVGSNVTIHLNSGAILSKHNKTKGMKVAASMFQTIRQSKSKKKGYYGGYNGERNITFEGDPGSYVDLNYFKTGLGIVAGHTRNLTIKGIGFRRMYYGHYIEISATQHTRIVGNRFLTSKRGGVKEAINVDTPDRTTGGVGYKWTKYDKTPNDDVLIQYNSFENMNRAVGTHKFSKGRYHNNIRILDNTVRNMGIDAFQLLNWRNSTVERNTVSDVGNYRKDTLRAFLVTGGYNNKITCNTMTRVARPIGVFPWQNSEPGRAANGWTYPTVTNTDRLWFSANRLGTSSAERDARYYTDRPTGNQTLTTTHNEKIDLSDRNFGALCTPAPRSPKDAYAPETTWKGQVTANPAAGTGLTLTSVGNGTYGTAVVQGGSVVYTVVGTPTSMVNDVVPVTLTDAYGRTVSGRVIVPIKPPPAPTAPDITRVIPKGTVSTQSTTIFDVVGGSTGFERSVDGFTQPATGSVAAVTGGLEYTALTGFDGTDTFTYVIRDLAGRLSAPGTVTVIVTPPPVAGDFTASVANAGGGDLDWMGAYDTRGEQLALEAWEPVGTLRGAVTQDGDTLHYTGSNTEVDYTDTIRYKVRDAAGQISGWATITIDVGSP